MPNYIIWNGQKLYVEGAYSRLNAGNLSGPGQASKGIVGLVDIWSQGGEPQVPVFVENAALLKAILPEPYATHAAEALFRPSEDEDIKNGASMVVLLRVNPATRAQKVLLATAAASMTLKYYDWGLAGNRCRVQKTTSNGRPVLTATLGTTSYTTGEVATYPTMLLKYEGSDVKTATLVWVKAAVVPDHGGEAGYTQVRWQVTHPESSTWDVDGSDLVVDGAPTFTIADVQLTDTTIKVNGTRKDGTESAEGGDEYVIATGQTSKLATRDYSAITSVVFPALATGTTFTVACDAFKLQTYVDGTPDYDTVTKVVSRIEESSAKGFRAELKTPTTDFAIADHDGVALASIEGAGLTTAADLWAFIEAIGDSVPLVTAERDADSEALPSDADAYLAGGSDGTTTTAHWEAALAVMKELDIQHVTTTSTDAAVHAKFKAHQSEMVGVNERNVFLGCPAETTLPNLAVKTLALNSRNIAMCCQEIKVYDNVGVARWKHPGFTALYACGCHAGSTGRTSIMTKAPNVLDVRDYPGTSGTDNWTTKNNLVSLYQKGLLVLRKDVDTKLFVWGRALTTHLADANPIYSSIFSNDMANRSVQNVRRAVKRYVATSNAFVSATGILEAARTELDRQKADKEIVGYRKSSLSIVERGDWDAIAYAFASAEDRKWITIEANIDRLAV